MILDKYLSIFRIMFHKNDNNVNISYLLELKKKFHLIS